MYYHSLVNNYNSLSIDHVDGNNKFVITHTYWSRKKLRYLH